MVFWQALNFIDFLGRSPPKLSLFYNFIVFLLLTEGLHVILLYIFILLLRLHCAPQIHYKTINVKNKKN